MSKPVRYAVLALVVLLVGAAVTGVAVWTAAHDPNDIAPGLYIDGRRVNEPGPALSLGGNEVDFWDYRQYYLVIEASMKMYYGDTLFDDDPDGDKALVLRDAVEQELQNMYAWLQIAEETGVSLNEEELAGVQTVLDEQKETYGEGFAEQLEGMFFESEEQYLRISQQQALSDKAQTEYRAALSEELADSVGAEADAAYDRDYISAKHILILFDSAETDTLKAEADALTEIEEILAKIRESEDPAATFDELMNTRSEDTGLATNPDGYTFKEGDMVEEFYTTALDTPEGEISEPVKSTYGYHIIMRLPLSDAERETQRQTAIDAAVTERVTERLAEVTEALALVPGSYYDDITPESIV